MVSFKIHILNWEKHNASKKRNHRSFLFEDRFFEDSTILKLSAMDALLFINALCLASDLTSSEFEVTPKSFYHRLRLTSNSLHDALERLQSFQLLTYEKVDAFNKTKEKKTKEDKTKQVATNQFSEKTQIEFEPEKHSILAGAEKSSKTKKELSSDQKDLNKRIWESYRSAYLIRWKVEPVRNQTVNGQISMLRSRLGEEAIDVVAFYLTSNNTFYVGKCHPIGLCLQDAEALRTQMLKGTAITGSMLKNYEKQTALQETLDRIDKEGI